MCMVWHTGLQGGVKCAYFLGKVVRNDMAHHTEVKYAGGRVGRLVRGSPKQAIGAEWPPVLTRDGG